MSGKLFSIACMYCITYMSRRMYIFSQPTRLYRYARVVINLVKNISAKCL